MACAAPTFRHTNDTARGNLLVHLEIHDELMFSCPTWKSNALLVARFKDGFPPNRILSGPASTLPSQEKNTPIFAGLRDSLDQNLQITRGVAHPIGQPQNSKHVLVERPVCEEGNHKSLPKHL